MSGGEGFSFDYGTASASATPLPPACTMMLIGIAGIGFVAYRRKSKTSVLAPKPRDRPAASLLLIWLGVG
jgi:hypothetical protein